MSYKNFRILYCLLALPLIIEQSLANPIPLAPGKGFFQLTTKYVRADKYADPNGNIIGIPATSDFVNGVFGELGLIKNVSLLINLPFYKHFVVNERIRKNETTGMYSKAANTGLVVRGMGDSQLGLKFGLVNRDRFTIGGQISITMPTHKIQQGEIIDKFELPSAEGMERGTDAMEFDAPVPLGSDDTPISIGLQINTMPSAFPLELETGFGFINRQRGPGTTDYSDAVSANAKAGVSWKRHYLLFSMDGVFPLSNGNMDKDFRYLAWGPQIYSNLIGQRPKLGITLGMESASFIRNTLAALAWKAGVYCTW